MTFLQESVEKWLTNLKMEDYCLKFEKAGYVTQSAANNNVMENLKEITERELEIDIGVQKPGIKSTMNKLTHWFNFLSFSQVTGKGLCKL